MLRRRFRHLGVRRTLAAYLGRALYRVGGVTVYTVICLEPERVRTDHVDRRGLEVAELDGDRLREAARDPALGLPAPRLAEELAKGDRCYGAFVDGALACYTFVAERPTVVQGEVVVTFDPAWALTRWTWTRPDRRGRGLYSAVKAKALADATGRGRKGLLGMVAAYNFESLHAAAHLGFRPVATMVVGEWRRRALTWCSPACATYGLALSTDPAGVAARHAA